MCISVALLTLMGCSSPDADWQKADGAGTVAAYQGFLNEHPNDTRAAQARERIQKLQDEGAWLQAQKTNTPEAFQAYVKEQPNGAHLSEARASATALERAADWKLAEADGKQPALEKFLQKYSQGPEVDEARTKLAQLTGYRVQLGSFRSKTEAEKDKARLQSRYGKVLQQIDVVSSSGPKPLNNVESGPMSQADAQAACATLTSAHQHCEVVKR
jgi:hypothetical protein